ncbi:MAG: hypothetical protein ACTHNQ_13150 [Microbacterium sp.]|uniref:hypothetical protein n=1 Tax=Microbacterium sp. TaxID=51671 RepID=UPI003F7DE92C
MGIFKPLGDMGKLVSAAPALIDQANQLQAQAAAYQQAAFAQQTAVAEPQPGALEPIAGVDLERYARISKGIAVYGYDASKLPFVAASFGVASDAWEAAQAGWAARIQADRGVGRRFNELYAAV